MRRIIRLASWLHKHFLRRYAVLKRRISEGEVELKHVPDTDRPADFLTKWIPSPKLKQSLQYACNYHDVL